MSTTHAHFTARNEGPPLTIFDLLADMPNYAGWLPGSEAFRGTIQALRYSARLGTTYLNAGAAGAETRFRHSIRPSAAQRFSPDKSQ
jgi:hypothetical protein